MAKKPSKTPLLLRLISLLGEVQLREEYIQRENGQDIYGYIEGNDLVVVNPIPHVVDTVLHELMHKLNPGYSEHAVRSMVGKLMKHMSDAEMCTIYELYRDKVD